MSSPRKSPRESPRKSPRKSPKRKSLPDAETEAEQPETKKFKTESLNVDDLFNTDKLSDDYEPEQLGFYSTDEKKYHHELNKIPYYKKPIMVDGTNRLKTPLNLDKGFPKRFKEYDGPKYPHYYFYFLLEWMTKQSDKFQSGVFEIPQIVCTRAIVQRILCGKDERDFVIVLVAQKVNNTVYILNGRTNVKKESNKTPDPIQALPDQAKKEPNKRMYNGLRFEKYMTSERKDGIPFENPIVYDNRSSFVVMKVKLTEDISMLMSGSPDCRETIDGQDEYVELKAAKKKPGLKYLSRPYWKQAFSLGIKKIVVGYVRDWKNPVVRTIKEEITKELVEDQKECVTFFKNFMKKLYDKMKVINDPHTAVEVELGKKNKEYFINYTKFDRDQDRGVLTDEQIKKLEKIVHSSSK